MEQHGAPNPATALRCEYCHRLLDAAPAASVGRPRKYCRRSCRQRAYERRRRLAELEWGESSLARLTDRLGVATEQLARIDDLIEEMSIDLGEGRPIETEELLERLVHARA